MQIASNTKWKSFEAHIKPDKRVISPSLSQSLSRHRNASKVYLRCNDRHILNIYYFDERFRFHNLQLCKRTFFWVVFCLFDVFVIVFFFAFAWPKSYQYILMRANKNRFDINVNRGKRTNEKHYTTTRMPANICGTEQNKNHNQMK